MDGQPRRWIGAFVAAVMAVASVTGLAAASPASAGTLRAGGAVPGTGTWRIQASPDVTTPSGSLASVSCVTARTCTAVGSYTNTAGQLVALAEAWDGTSWHRQPVPSPAGSRFVQLNGVSCASPSFCEAVGQYLGHHETATVGFAAQWNGRTWNLQTMPAPGGSSDVEPAAASCATANFCEAVGHYESSPGVYSPLAEVWNGTSWTPQPAGAAGLELGGVSCRRASFCEAVGSGSPRGQNAEMWNGRSWSPQLTPAPVHAVGLALSGVSCAATDVCEATGDWLAPGGELPRAVTLAEGWNGKTWAIQHTPSPRALPYSALGGVSCTSARFCSAVGSNYDPVSASSVTLAEEWNGTSWRMRPTPKLPPTSTFVELNSVSCTATNACEAAGINQQASFAALAESWDGLSWKIQPGAAPAGATNNFLFAVSCVTAGFCEAVGNSLDPTGRNIALAEVWNGATWKIQPIPSPAKMSNIRALLLGVSCVSVRFCIAVGQSNSVPGLFTEVWNGTSWKIQTAPGNGNLASVSCPSVHFCAAVGGTGTISGASAEVDLWNGRSWSAVPPAPGFTSLTSVSCATASFCEAVGAGSSGPGAQVWNGRSWSPQSTPLPAGVSPQLVNLNGVSCAAPHACEAVGGYVTGALRSATLAEAWNGKTWAIQRSPSPQPGHGPSLTAVWCATAVSCTAVGNIGQLGSSRILLTLAAAWDGRSWQLQPTPTPHQFQGGGALEAVWCSASRTCTAVGSAANAGGTPATLVEARS